MLLPVTLRPHLTISYLTGPHIQISCKLLNLHNYDFSGISHLLWLCFHDVAKRDEFRYLAEVSVSLSTEGLECRCM